MCARSIRMSGTTMNAERDGGERHPVVPDEHPRALWPGAQTRQPPS
jgi:hypothetical protein